MPFTEDFTVFTDPTGSGTTVTYTPVGGVASSVNGIFDAEYEEALGMEGSAPVFACAAADVPNARHGDELRIDGVDYVVRGVRPDGTGWTRLIVELADG
jgi:20S proteasome alpha/beta subunit